MYTDSVLVSQDFPCGHGRGSERGNCRQDSVDRQDQSEFQNMGVFIM